MSDLSAEIDAIWIRFREQVAEAFTTAHDVAEPAGTSAAWQALCERHGAPLISDAERMQVLAAQRPLRGVPAMELQPVVKAICREHRIACKKIDVWDAGSSVESKHQSLMSLIERTETELLTAYRGAVLPKPGGMFAHVFSGGAPAAQQTTRATAITCKACGGPRLSDRDLTCAYCATPFA
jgi:hypothetical protein